MLVQSLYPLYLRTVYLEIGVHRAVKVLLIACLNSIGMNYRIKHRNISFWWSSMLKTHSIIMACIWLKWIYSFSERYSHDQVKFLIRHWFWKFNSFHRLLSLLSAIFWLSKPWYCVKCNRLLRFKHFFQSIKLLNFNMKSFEQGSSTSF